MGEKRNEVEEVITRKVATVASIEREGERGGREELHSEATNACIKPNNHLNQLDMA